MGIFTETFTPLPGGEFQQPRVLLSKESGHGWIRTTIITRMSQLFEKAITQVLPRVLRCFNV
jgi:hypothetical protein